MSSCMPSSSSSSSSEATLLNKGSFVALRCFTKSTTPPLYWKVTVCSLPGRSSVKTTSRPLLRNAIVCRRSITVRATNSVPSEAKMVSSGQKVTVVPFLRPRAGVLPVFASLPFGLPPSTNSMPQRSPSRSISRTTRRDNALTTLTPTPCRPPETL